MSFLYNRLQFDAQNIENLASLFKNKLQEIIYHTMGRKEKELTPSDLGYTGITIEELDRITRGVKRKLGQNTGINSIYPLSPMQNGMLYHQIAEKNSGAYFLQNRLTIEGELEVPLLKESFRQLSRRYDIFRTLFIHDGLDNPLQIVLEPRENQVRFSYEDITYINDEKQMQTYLETLQHRDKEKGFDLSGDMPIRLTIYKTGLQTYHIIWSFFHIIMDGWCLGIVFTEMLHYYQNLKERTPIQLQPVTPYRKYIRWLENQDKNEGMEFWQNYLEGYEQMAILPKAKGAEVR
ncbi:MAG: hypothetical protein GY757_45020, partial [bacterium]|nr:hypothetical protein [bacterium]